MSRLVAQQLLCAEKWSIRTRWQLNWRNFTNSKRLKSDFSQKVTRDVNKEKNNVLKYDCDFTKLVFYVNGRRVEDAHVDPRTTLAVYLRDSLRLTGTKIGCNEGGCGACTVMVSDRDPLRGNIRHYSVNSCLTPVCSLFGKAVTTVEGIGNTKNPHAVQERLAKANGSQCGFCTPGFVMAMYALLRNNPKPSIPDVDEAIQGNLCRCTGYRPILDAFYSFTREAEERANSTTNCSCGSEMRCPGTADGSSNSSRTELTKLHNLKDCKQYDPQEEHVFPPELLVEDYWQKSFCMESDGYAWHQPTTLEHLLHLKKKFPNGRIICGNSEVGVDVKFLFSEVQNAINMKQVSSLRNHYLDHSKGVYFGSGLSLSEIQKILPEYIEKVPEHQRAVFRAVTKMLHWFAGKHVRNVATIGGNIATASPISDLNPLWMAANASVVVASEDRGERVVPLDENFFTGYRRTVIQPDELILGIWIPLGKKSEFFRAYKQSQRREDDISIVTGAFLARLDPLKHTVNDIRISYGGVAPTTKAALNTMAALKGRKWDKETLQLGLEKLQKEFALPPGVPGGMERFRETLIQSLFLKFFTYVGDQLKISGFSVGEVESAYTDETRKIATSQIYQDVPKGQLPSDPIGRPLIHRSGLKHATGEAKFCDDEHPSDAWSVVLVHSPVANGVLESVDASEAMKIAGVKGYIDYHDVPEGMMLGFAQDSPVFVKDKISYHWQPVGAIVADSHETARRAARLVKVKCSAAKPILTIEDAIANDSYIIDKPYVIRSDMVEDYGTHDAVTTDWSKYDRVIEGSVRLGGQEHFYMEPHSCFVVPYDDDEVEVISCTQCVNDVQLFVSMALGVPQNKVAVKVRRIGGGFGGKESSSSIFVVPTALAATKYRKPMRFTAERNVDMAVSGQRHPFRCDYKFGLTNDGKIQNFKTMLYSNGGHSLDLSAGVMHRALVHADNAYRFPNATIFGRMCKTNLPSSTAFRGFGAPEAMFAAETMMVHAAEELGINVNELREKNFYEEGECTPFGLHLHQCNLRRCWDECKQLSDYEERLDSVHHFNSNNKYIKRGIFMTPTRFGIGFGIRQLNQAGALVRVYEDGSILVSHGGMEMGQGLHTKIQQITARCMGVGIERVHIKDTSTEAVPNASPTAGSVGSDLNGLAVMDACNKINERLKPLRKANPEFGWEELVKKAYFEKTCLFSSGFATLPLEQPDFFTGKGAEMFSYCVYGAGCSEVEVDCLTGDHRLLRTDIVMDVGDSLNPAIDIGQIEGAFMQGYGLFTMEELKVRPNGARLTTGPGTYKIPTADDTPRQFHVKLLKGSSNKMAIFSSKAIGEPPLFLSASAFFALREAVKSFREDRGLHGYFRLDSPATPERIRMCCEDEIAKRVAPLPDRSKFVPWTVEL